VLNSSSDVTSTGGSMVITVLVMGFWTLLSTNG